MFKKLPINLPQLKVFLSNRTNQILVGVLALIILGGFFAYTKLTAVNLEDLPVEEIDLAFDAEGPYALLEPRRDGNALILNITRVASYESIGYEMAYASTGSTAGDDIGSVDRGVQGILNTKDKKSEYSQEVLFGTCSRADTFALAHCVFDKGVENGTLTLKIEKKLDRGAKKRTVFKMNTTWHLQKPDVALGKISSGDDHFQYITDAKREDLANIAWSIVNDLTGVPKLPEGKVVLGKVYALNIPATRVFPAGEVLIELAESPVPSAKIYRYISSENKWEELETKTEGSKLNSTAKGAGIFAVLINNQ